MRYLTLCTMTCAALFLLQGLALRMSGGSTIKSESNFYSSLARVQSGTQGQPDIMLLGSSLTGRFPDRSHGFAGVANIGCDGGSAADLLRAIDQGLLPATGVLVIEGNTFYRATGDPISEIHNALRSPWFRVGLQLPLLSAYARPAAFLYSPLLARKIGRAQGPAGPLLPVSSVPEVVSHPNHLSDEARTLVDEMAGIFQRLQSRNIRLLLVILPPGAEADSPNIRIPRELSRLSGVPLLDLTRNLPPDAVRYTDGVHMDPASAAKALRTILMALDRLPMEGL